MPRSTRRASACSRAACRATRRSSCSTTSATKSTGPTRAASTPAWSSRTRSSSSRTDNPGLIAPKTIEVWSMVSVGTQQISSVQLPLEILVFSGGITTVVQLPQLAPVQTPQFFQDYDAYPVLLVDPIAPGISIGKPLAGEVVGTSDVAGQGYTFERCSG